MSRDLTAMVAWLSVGAGFAAAQTPRVTVEPSSREFTVGDRVSMDVVVDHAVTDSIVWPEITDPMGDFEVIEAEAVRPTVQNDRQISVLRLILTAFELGEREFPGVTVAVAGSDGEVRMEIDTDPVTLTVVSVGLDDSGDIRDIKGPLAIERNWLLVAPWLLLAAALGAFGLWAYRRFTRREAADHRPPVPAAPPRPPHEIALEAFGALRASPLLERGEIKQYFTEASDILRRFIEARFDVEAMELPSADILDGLRRAGVTYEALRPFDEFFRRADLVKFAKQRPTPEVSVGIVDLGEEIVRGAAGSADTTDVSDSTDGTDDIARQVSAVSAASDESAASRPVPTAPQTTAPSEPPASPEP